MDEMYSVHISVSSSVLRIGKKGYAANKLNKTRGVIFLIILQYNRSINLMSIDS